MKEILLETSRSPQLDLPVVAVVEAGSWLVPVRNTSSLVSISDGANNV